MFKCKGKGKGSKRILAVALILIGLALVATSVYADSGLTRFSNNQNVKMYVIENIAATRKWTAVSTSTIVPSYNRIIGYEVCPYATAFSVDNFIALADDSTVAGVAATDVFGESEAATGSSLSKWLPYPRELSTGLVVHQGAYTYAIIYYEDKREI